MPQQANVLAGSSLLQRPEPTFRVQPPESSVCVEIQPCFLTPRADTFPGYVYFVPGVPVRSPDSTCLVHKEGRIFRDIPLPRKGASFRLFQPVVPLSHIGKQIKTYESALSRLIFRICRCAFGTRDQQWFVSPVNHLIVDNHFF